MNSKPTEEPFTVRVEVRAAPTGVEDVRQTLHQDWYTVKEVAELLGRHEKTVRAWIKEGKLKCYKPAPRSTRVAKEQLARFLSH